MNDRTQTALLEARQAHQRRQQSVDHYRQAIAQATAAGCSFTDIARTLGITRQAVRQYTLTNT
jgi:DNA-binding NarL/FixJ family response regulator